MKVFAGRGKDWQDAEGIAIRQRLDRKRILQQYSRSAKSRMRPIR